MSRYHKGEKGGDLKKIYPAPMIRMTEQNKKSFRQYVKYAAVILIGVLVIVGVWIGTKNFEKIVPPDTSTSENTSGKGTSGENGSEDVTKDADVSSENASKENGPSASSSESLTTEEPTSATVSGEDAMNVDRLIDRYYTAKINDDADELNKIVEAESTYSEDNLRDENQFIEKYDNFHTYVVPGLTDNYFIVYVRYDIYFNGITVGAPSLNHFIVAKQDDSHYYIYDKAISGEFQSYIEETERSEAVLTLRHQVEKDLEEACEKNADLKFLMQILNGETESATASSESSEDTSEADTSEVPSSEEDLSGSGSEDSTSQNP